MNKTITICGYDIPVTYNASSLIRYKMAFGRDGMRDLMNLSKAAEAAGGMISEEFDSSIFYNFLWIFAKQADPDIPDLVEWMDQFDVEPLDFVQEALPQVMNMLVKNMQTTVKPKKK